jgi:hypothetical protein
MLIRNSRTPRRGARLRRGRRRRCAALGAQARQGEAGAVRYLLRKGLEANPRSRYVHLAWALWEKRQGELDDARRLFERGCKLNPCDAALRQVPRCARAPLRVHARRRACFAPTVVCNVCVIAVRHILRSACAGALRRGPKGMKFGKGGLRNTLTTS